MKNIGEVVKRPYIGGKQRVYEQRFILDFRSRSDGLNYILEVLRDIKKLPKLRVRLFIA